MPSPMATPSRSMPMTAQPPPARTSVEDVEVAAEIAAIAEAAEAVAAEVTAEVAATTGADGEAAVLARTKTASKWPEMRSLTSDAATTIDAVDAAEVVATVETTVAAVVVTVAVATTLSVGAAVARGPRPREALRPLVPTTKQLPLQAVPRPPAPPEQVMCE